jgi:hypothetical protein
MKPSRRHRSVRRTATARSRARRAAARRKASALRAWLSRVAAATGRPGGVGEARGVGDIPPPAAGRDARASPRATRRTQRQARRVALLRALLRKQLRAPVPSGAKTNSPSQTKGEK